MKRFLFISLLSVFFISCQPEKFVYKSDSSVIDYLDYSNKNFFITESPSVSFDYTPLGSVVVTLSSGYEIYSYTSKERRYQWRYATYKNALELLYQKSLDIKANGIIGLKYNYIPEIVNDKDKNNPISPSKIILSGMAIRR